MKTIIKTFFVFFFIFLIIVLSVLSTIGIETKKFNNIISNKINQNNSNVKLSLNSIKFKLDLKEISLFLETNDSVLNYRDAIIPTKNIRVYVDFFSILKSETQIKRVSLISNKIDFNELKKILITLKPSTFTSFLNNKIQNGTINTEIDFYLNNENTLENFIARGSVSNLNLKILKNSNLKKAKFTFFADKTDVLIKNFSGNLSELKIENGDLKLNLASKIFIESNFKTFIKFSHQSNDFKNLISNNEYLRDLKSLNAETNNNFRLNFDKTYKLENFNFNCSGKIKKASFNINNSINKYLNNESINLINILNTEIKTNINSESTSLSLLGNYSTDNKKFLKFDLKNQFKKENLKFELNADYDEEINLKLINYNKPKDKVAKINIKLSKQKLNYKFSEINFSEGKNLISANGIKFKKNKFISLEKISVKTFKNGLLNNDFSLEYGKDIKIKGSQFDANNLPKLLNQNNQRNNLGQVSKDIEIDLLNMSVPLSEKLKNFKLIGRIDNGRFSKISAKGDFGNNNFLDVSMINDNKNKKKYLEIYSDLTKPLLTEYSFFRGLTGGKLLFTSVIGDTLTSSKLNLENFKVINAPGMVKLLTLADLGGLADLAEGDGISFDTLEISMEKTGDLLKINEILALGPSISVLMEGYQNSSTTSLRGSLVPAKTLNKLISKIPVIGDIVIPKEVGEGMFGISFKIKGPPGKIKTSINPIRTITPRFIQKIIDKKRNIK